MRAIILFVTFCKPYETRTVPFKFVIRDDPNAVNTTTSRRDIIHKVLETFIVIEGPNSPPFASVHPKSVMEAAIKDAIIVHQKLYSEIDTIATINIPTTCSCILELPTTTSTMTLGDSSSVATISSVGQWCTLTLPAPSNY